MTSKDSTTSCSKKFHVVCGNCDNPEKIIFSNKKESVVNYGSCRCKGCGSYYDDVDTSLEACDANCVNCFSMEQIHAVQALFYAYK